MAEDIGIIPAVLGVIINGVLNRKEGLPFLTTPEQKAEHYKQKAEQRKETIGLLDKEAQKHIEIGSQAGIDDLAPALSKQGVPPEVIAAMRRRAWQTAWDQGPTKDMEQSIMSLIAKQAGGQSNQSEQTVLSSMTPPAPNTPLYPDQGPTNAKAASLPGKVYESTEQIPHFQTLMTAAQKYGIKDPSHFISMVQAESNFNPQAVSPKGAMGLGQVMPNTATGMGYSPKQMFDPEINADASARYYKQQEDRFKGDPSLISAAYNAGPENVTKYGGIPPFEETQEYVQKVNDYHQHYSKLMGGSAQSPYPLIQQFPSMGNLPAPQQSILDNTARTLKINISENGKRSFSFSPLATPTLDEQTASFMQTLPPQAQKGLLWGMIAAKANKQEVREWKLDENTGMMGIATFDPLTGNHGFIPIHKSGMTPGEKAAMEIETAKQRKFEETIQAERAKLQASQTPSPTGKTLPSGQPEMKPAYQIEGEQKAETQAKLTEGEAIAKRRVEMTPVRAALGLLKKYSKEIHTAPSDEAARARVIQGTGSKLKSWAGVGAAKNYTDYAQAFLGEIARVFGAERGVLTNQDVERASRLIPDLYASGPFARNRLEVDMDKFLSDLEGRTPQTAHKEGIYEKDHIYLTPKGVPVIYKGESATGGTDWEPLQYKQLGE